MPEHAHPSVLVYVRKGGKSDNRRMISFIIPPGLDPADLLTLGYAIDGDTARLTVQPPTGAILSDQLRNTQHLLVDFLHQRGFVVQFV